MIKLFILNIVLLTSIILPQNKNDSVSVKELNTTSINTFSLRADWNIFTSPFRFSPSDMLFINFNNTNSLYSSYLNAQMNTGFQLGLKPDDMLNQFKIANSWEAQKKYGVFAKYLGIAEFMGAVGLAAIHISKYHRPPKGKTNFDSNKLFPKGKVEKIRLKHLTE